MPTLAELNKQLLQLPPKKIAEICIRISRFKRDNKELLDYLLNDQDNEEAFRRRIMEMTEAEFVEMNRSNLYLVKKSLRKILRVVHKNIRYSGNKETEAALLIHFLRTLRSSGIPYAESPVLVNLYINQLKRIQKAVASLHEDLQFDFRRDLDEISSGDSMPDAKTKKSNS